MTASRKLVVRYYLFRATNSAGFYLPVAILYLQDREFGLEFIGTAYAVFGFATLAAEVPTGYVGDRLGRRGSLAAGATLRTVVLAAYPFITTAAGIILLHVLWATGRAFRSGTQDAWLYELLQAHLDTDDFTRIESRGRTVVLTVSAAGAVIGAALYTQWMAAPFLVNAGLALLGLPLLATFSAPRGVAAGGQAAADRGPQDDAFGVREALAMLRVQVGRPEIRWIVAYAALFHALFLVTRIYEQPALTAVGVPVTGLGVIYAAFKLVSAGAASTTGWLHDHLGARGVFLLLIPIYGLTYLAVAVWPLLVVPVLFVNRATRTVTTPIRNQYLNDRLDDVGRATVLSGAAMALSLVGASARLIAGQVAAVTGAVGLLPVAATVVALAGGMLWIAVSPVRTRYERDSETSMRSGALAE